MVFRKNTSSNFTNLLKGITSQQSRTLLILGDEGWGKVACALDLAQMILNQNPLTSSNFFYFRNTAHKLKTEFFLKKHANTEESWTWLALLQRRINISAAIEETLTMPTGVKLPAIKEQLEEYISKHSFPQDEKFINQLIQVSEVLDKKSGIPINVIRESIKFHSVKTEGRVSILADFDTSDATTQNSALKLIEEPNPNHWLILTGKSENSFLQTILSRTLKISLKKPLPNELSFLGQPNLSARLIMDESVNKTSSVKLSLLKEFFIDCVPRIEREVSIVLFAEKISKNHQTLLLLNELILILQDSLRIRQGKLRNINIPMLMPQYEQYSLLFSKASTAELEELTLQIEQTILHVRRSVIKDDHLLPKLLLDISRLLRTIR